MKLAGLLKESDWDYGDEYDDGYGETLYIEASTLLRDVVTQAKESGGSIDSKLVEKISTWLERNGQYDYY